MTTTRMGKDFCPNCGKCVDSATSAYDNESIPKPGDLSVCFGCGAFLKFSNDMSLDELHPIVFEALDEETQMQLLKVKEVIESRQMQNN